MSTKKKTCSLCDKPSFCRGYCRNHYAKFMRGTLNTVRKIDNLPNLKIIFCDFNRGYFLILPYFYGIPSPTEDDVMTQKSIYRLIAQGGLDDWYNLDHRISNDFPR